MTIRVGFQGKHGTFSEIAAMRYFAGTPMEAVGYPDFIAIMKDCAGGKLQYAVLPVENTTTGIIARTYDLFQKYPVHAVGEINVPIEENLIVLPGAKIAGIREVYSHPEAISQCSGFFRRHPAMHPVAYQDTAASVEYIKQCQDPVKAALASSRAAEYYGMESILRKVQDSTSNLTRFLCVTALEQQDPEADKISMMLVLRHEPGSLCRILEVLAARQINILKLESRPIPGRIFEYCFYIDFHGNVQSPEIQQVLEDIRRDSTEMKILGCYKAAPQSF